ncbi:MAG: hypothetical protein GX115_05265 [Ruminiclostridium sp.]|nr:hypothetical protein [Ruminiclostridium sp.]
MDQILGGLLQGIATLFGEKTVIEANLDPDDEDNGYLSVKNKHIQISIGTNKQPEEKQF